MCFNNEHKIQSRLLWIEWTNRARNNIICKKNYIISRKIPPIRTTLPNRRSCKFSQETERKSGWQREWGREPERRRMGRSPCCSKEGLNRGAWTVVEDKILTEYIKVHGEGRWRNLPKKAGGLICVEFEKKNKNGMWVHLGFLNNHENGLKSLFFINLQAWSDVGKVAGCVGWTISDQTSREATYHMTKKISLSGFTSSWGTG